MTAPSWNFPAPHAPTKPGFVGQLTTMGNAGTPEFDAGNGLLGTLQLPGNLNANSPFTWQVHLAQKNPIMGPYTPGHDPSKAQLTQMTMAGAMSWLRDLAANQSAPGGDYDAIVHQLVAAGYLSPADARYGGFTTQVANAFLRSAADVWSLNQRSETGQLTTWGDNINGIIQGRIAAGQIDANGMPLTAGSQGPQAPTRTDRFTSPEDVKASINNAAENILGRKLTDKEVAGFQSLYHGLEAKSNDQVWAQQLSQFNNQSSTPNTAPPVTTPPSPAAEAQNYMQDAPAFGQERSTQLLGSYIGVLRNMTGLGAGGVSHAVS